MKTALLISTYNWPEALDLVLKSILNQSQMPDEILIADDGSTTATKEVIDLYGNKFKIPVIHVWQEDKGFRKSAILNKAVAKSTADYIIEIDGDCIPNKHFIKDHILLSKKNHFLYGSRVNIQESFLPKLFNKKIIDFNLFSEGIKKRTRTLRVPLFAKWYKPSPILSRKLRGCNMSFFREDFIKVNGYNEDFEGWGKEDSEFALRLLNSGVFGKRIRYAGVVYHIWHKEKPKDRLAENEQLQTLVMQTKEMRCLNGIDKYL